MPEFSSFVRAPRGGVRTRSLDGGFGTELLRRGLTSAELAHVNLTQPRLVSEVSRAYAEAGAELVRTHSFQANSLALAAYGLAREAPAVNRAAAELARAGAGADVLVVGSLGPVGMRFRTPEISPVQAMDLYAEQALALVAGGADALVLETLLDPEEARLAVRALVSAVPVPIGVSMTFRATASGFATLLGATPATLLALAHAEGAAFVAANCGEGLERLDELAAELTRSQLPVWLAPSAGLPGRAAATPGEFAELAARVEALGVAAFGGCCGTDPSHVRAIAQRLRDHARPA